MKWNGTSCVCDEKQQGGLFDDYFKMKRSETSWWLRWKYGLEWFLVKHEHAKKVQSEVIILQKVECFAFCLFEHVQPGLYIFGQNLDINSFNAIYKWAK